MYLYAFEKLEVWRLSRSLRNKIYKLSSKFPEAEKYGLTNQIRRSINSITDNLAEGSGRATQIDRAHFINVAYSSCLESLNQLITANDQNYITEIEYQEIRKEYEHLLNKLNAYYKSQKVSKENLKNDRFK
jgi:four helix bundle protein